jgi:Flp pilus assembly protein TadB
VKRNMPVVITDAAESPAVQLRRRQIRYFTMMSLRVVCVILAAILAAAEVPMLGLWLAVLVAGAVLLPWFAVLIANDRPAKSKAERRAQANPRPAVEPQALPPAQPGPTIDGDVR